MCMKLTNLFDKQTNFRKVLILLSITLFSFGYSNPVNSSSWRLVSKVDEMTNIKQTFYTKTIKSGIHKFVTKLTCNYWQLDGYTEVQGKNQGLFARDTYNNQGTLNLNLDGKYLPSFVFNVDNTYSNRYYIGIGDNPNKYFYFDAYGERSGTTSEIFSSKIVKIQFPVSGYGKIIFTLNNEIDPWTKLQPLCKK